MRRRIPFSNFFARELSSRMKLKRISFYGCSEATGVSVNLLENLESGRSLPCGPVLVALCSALDIPVVTAQIEVSMDKLERKHGTGVWHAAEKILKRISPITSE